MADILVTGGGGFLGRHIVNLLLERGDSVSIFNRSQYPDLEARAGLFAKAVHTRQEHIAGPTQVHRLYGRLVRAARVAQLIEEIGRSVDQGYL